MKNIVKISPTRGNIPFHEKSMNMFSRENTRQKVTKIDKIHHNVCHTNVIKDFFI